MFGMHGCINANPGQGDALDNEATKALIARARPLIAGFSDRTEFEPVGGKGV
jgi:hypothetical protein